MQSSGDLIADRRFAYGEALSAEGDHAAAVDLFAQTLERVPGWAPAWLALGLAQDRIGDRPAAVAAFSKAQVLDADDGLGASLHVARLNGTPIAGMASRYIATLFDQYADRFDQHLTGGLGYRGPAVLLDALARAAPRRSHRAALDLGCGTGLVARALADHVDAIDGVDLSPRMVEHARATGLYRDLQVADLASALEGMSEDRYDLALAADVFVYVGDLAAIFEALARVLEPAGLLAFTVQAAPGDRYSLGPDLRFSHSLAYLQAALAAAGLTVLLAEPQSTRQDAGIDVPGLVVVARNA